MEAISPKKTDIEKETNYNLHKSKRPEPQFYVQESSNKTQPSSVICQNLSLDQRIKGQTKIRQRVQYENDSDFKTPEEHKVKPKEDKKIKLTESKKFYGVSETYEESTHEQTSANCKFDKLTTLQNYSKKTSNKNLINESSDKFGGKVHFKEDAMEHIQLVTHKNICGNQSNSSLSQSKDNLMMNFNKVANITKAPTSADKSELEHPQHNKYLRNNEQFLSKYNSYTYKEESSTKKHIEKTKHENIKTYNKHESPAIKSQEQSDTKIHFPHSDSQKKITQEIPENKTPATEFPRKEAGAIGKVNDATTLHQKFDNELELEEILEEQNEVRTKKRIIENTKIVHGKGETSYKLPSQLPISKKHSSQYEIVIKKIEIPGPQYIIRKPKLFLVEYEAYPTHSQKPYELQTKTLEETSLTVTTNKTFMVFKKIEKKVQNIPFVGGPASGPAIENGDSQEDKESLIHKQLTTKFSHTSLGPRNPEEKQFNNIPAHEKEIDEQISNKINSDKLYEKYEYSEKSSKTKENYSKKEEKIMHKQKFDVKENKSRPFIDKTNQPNELLPVNKRYSEVQDTNNTNTFQNISTREEVETMEKSSEKKIKIVVGSYMQQKASLILPQGKSNINLNSMSLPVPEGRTKNKADQFISEEYYESVMKEEKQKSAQKHFVSFKETKEPTHPGGANEHGFLRNERLKDFIKQEPRYAEIKAESGGKLNDVSVNEEYNTGKNKLEMLQKGFVPVTEDKSLQLDRSSNVPINKNDGDIVIYIRQPNVKQECHSPKITVDVSDDHEMTSEELIAQKVQIHEIKKDNKKHMSMMKTVDPRKSKSADIYYAPTSGTPEEDVNTNSNEKILNIAQYNVTFESTTKVNTEKSHNTHKKSTAEVKMIPLNRSVTPTRVLRDQEHFDGMNKCCDAFKTSEIPDSNSDATSCLVDPSESKVGVGGANQSPIRIDTRSAIVQKYPGLQFYNHWNVIGDALLVNNGKTLRATLIENNKPLPFLHGGPLEGNYIFQEVHFHWGIKDCCGTEHVIDGQKYAVEAHFLYFKNEYQSMGEAVKYSNGLAVVAIILTVGGPVNAQFAELMKDMHLLREANSGTYVPATSVFAWIKPAIDSAKGYFCYRGNLLSYSQSTENTTWLLFPEPVLFCCQQSIEFRKLRTLNGDLLRKNYRTLQPLNNRIVNYVPV